MLVKINFAMEYPDCLFFSASAAHQRRQWRDHDCPPVTDHLGWFAAHSAISNSLARGLTMSKVAQRPSDDHQG
jgi:hypothetical protein